MTHLLIAVGLGTGRGFGLAQLFDHIVEQRGEGALFVGVSRKTLSQLSS
jgi:hypothetical protein